MDVTKFDDVANIYLKIIATRYNQVIIYISQDKLIGRRIGTPNLILCYLIICIPYMELSCGAI